MDPLEDFVRKHREEFDDREPSAKAWKNIKNKMGFEGRSVSLWNSLIVWRAAALVFMVLFFYLLIPKNIIKEDRQQAVYKEFADVETFYNQQISLKEELIGEFKNAESLENFTHDFQQLEAMYTVLKDEMKARPSKKVKDALVLNLLVRINLLNQQLEKLEDEDKDVKQKRESNS